MAQRVRFRGVQDRARIAVDHDVRIARLVADGLALAGFAGLDMLAARTRVGRIARHRENGQRRGKAEDSPAMPDQGSDPPRQHASPVLCRSGAPGRAPNPWLPWPPKGRAKKGEIRNALSPLFNYGAAR